MRDAREIELFANSRGEGTPQRLAYERAMFEGCVPQLYWLVSQSDVKHNVDPFRSIVLPYKRKMRTAYKNGYGLLFMGDNGTGKTMFISYLLGRAVSKGFSIYYTTLKRLDLNIKRGFDDPAAARRLRAALGADFLAIDELAKEHAKSDFLTSELEDLLKGRYDDGYPTLLASNLNYNDLSEMYGPTISSMLDGRYQRVELSGGDYRQKIAGAMRTAMGYR